MNRDSLSLVAAAIKGLLLPLIAGVMIMVVFALQGTPAPI